MRKIARHLDGDAQDLSQIPLDFAKAPPFHRKVYAALLSVPSGKTVTYAELARRAGSPGAVRAVGQAMAKNPIPIVVACHRVLAAGNGAGGFSAPGGTATKTRLLAIEGVRLGPDEPLFTGSSPRLPFDVDEAVGVVSKGDAKLARLIAKVGPFGLKLKQTEGAFAALAESIVYQQLNGKAAATILGRVKVLFGVTGSGPRTPTGSRPSSDGFFSPHHVLAAKDADLRAAGLSRAKQLALRDLAEKAEAGLVPTLPALSAMSDEEIVQALLPIRGIGRWTVEMMLIFRLGRPDVLPLGDYGVRQGFQRTFGTKELPTAAQMERRGEKWRPYRTVASWYLWRALEL
jgi:methylated-DNA-[protein]-cysteine S-methyltransferase